ncbi:MAG: hypothetical protein AAFO89_12090, partial [Planctomycetota bacterium]
MDPYELEPVPLNRATGPTAPGDRPGSPPAHSARVPDFSALHAVMASGMSLVLAGISVELLSVVVSAIATGTAQSQGLPPPVWAEAVRDLGRLIGASIAAAGWWRATSPVYEPGFLKGRAATRALAATIAAVAWLLALDMLIVQFAGANAVLLLLAVAGVLAYLAAYIAIYFVQLVFLASYAERFRDSALAARARRMM